MGDKIVFPGLANLDGVDSQSELSIGSKAD
jgi:hypothetical protein